MQSQPHNKNYIAFEDFKHQTETFNNLNQNLKLILYTHYISLEKYIEYYIEDKKTDEKRAKYSLQDIIHNIQNIKKLEPEFNLNTFIVDCKKTHLLTDNLKNIIEQNVNANKPNAKERLIMPDLMAMPKIPDEILRQIQANLKQKDVKNDIDQILEIFNKMFKKDKKTLDRTPQVRFKYCKVTNGVLHLKKEGKEHFLNKVKQDLGIQNALNDPLIMQSDTLKKVDTLIKKICIQLESLKGDKDKEIKENDLDVGVWGTIKTVLTIALILPLIINKVFKGNWLGNTQKKREINKAVEELLAERAAAKVVNKEM